jgi:hypothetical protein
LRVPEPFLYTSQHRATVSLQGIVEPVHFSRGLLTNPWAGQASGLSRGNSSTVQSSRLVETLHRPLLLLRYFRKNPYIDHDSRKKSGGFLDRRRGSCDCRAACVRVRRTPLLLNLSSVAAWLAVYS